MCYEIYSSSPLRRHHNIRTLGLNLQSAEGAALFLRRGFGRAGAADSLNGAPAHLRTHETQTIARPHH